MNTEIDPADQLSNVQPVNDKIERFEKMLSDISAEIAEIKEYLAESDALEEAEVKAVRESWTAGRAAKTLQLQEIGKRQASIEGMIEMGRIASNALEALKVVMETRLTKDKVRAALDDLQTQANPDYETVFVKLGMQSLSDREGDAIEYSEEEQQELDVSTG